MKMGPQFIYSFTEFAEIVLDLIFHPDLLSGTSRIGRNEVYPAGAIEIKIERRISGVSTLLIAKIAELKKDAEFAKLVKDAVSAREKRRDLADDHDATEIIGLRTEERRLAKLIAEKLEVKFDG